MTTLSSNVLSFSPDVLIDLYEIDLSPLDGPTLYLTPNREFVLPRTVVRLEDAVATSGVFTLPIPYDFPVGGYVTIDGFVRMVGAGYFPRIGIDDAEPTNREVGMRINPTTLASSFSVTGTPCITSHFGSVSMAGEFLYFRVGGIVAAAASGRLQIKVFPALGTAYPAGDAAAQGAVELANVGAYVGKGGERQSIPLDASAALWVPSAGASVPAEVANSYQAVKVPVHNGYPYTPIPIEATGFAKDGQGSFPKPRLALSNVFGETAALAQEYGDLRGALFTRRRIYSQNLDNGLEPDAAATMTPDVFRITRKSLQDDTRIEWELSSDLDQQGAQLPARRVLRDVCDWTYRTWNPTTSTFDYTDVICPYNGTNYFTVTGAVTTNPAEDRCSRKRLTGCLKRFPKGVDSPFGAFPMVGRTRA